MATTEEITQQFQYAFNAKEDIKDAINEKGVEVTDSTPLGEYGNRVRQINQNLSPFDYSTGTDSAIQKSQDPNDANVADGYHAGAFGTSNSAPEDNSFAIGNDLTTGADNQTVVGQHNEVSNDSLFVVGNGVDAQNKSNAFEVKADGTATVGANPSSPMGVATKEYVDAGLSEKANTDGYYKEMTVGYSEQLLSTTGVETNDAFITRCTAVVEDVTSGPVQIRKIKGNTINWNQLVDHGNFDVKGNWRISDATAVTSFTVEDNIATVVAANGATNAAISQVLRTPIIDHKYAVRYTIKSTETNKKVGVRYGGDPATGYREIFTVGRSWTFCSILLEAKSDAYSGFTIYVEGGATYNIKNAMLFDLTQMFGEGKEPTLDEFNAMYNDNYYPYNAGELISSKPSGMQTVEFNLCSCANIFEKTVTGYLNSLTGDDFTTVKNWLKSLQTYNQSLIWEIDNSGYIGGTPSDTAPVGSIYCGDPNAITLQIRPGVEFSLSSIDIDSLSRIIFYGRTDESITFSNACMHFVWSGSRNGDFEPFKQNTLAIDTATYFPNGMRSAPLDVYDEINFGTHKAIARCGMRAYQSGDESDTTVITDGTNTVYPLPAPAEVPIPEDTPDIYQVDDWGTETWLQIGNPDPAAPVISELFYYANLRDKLQHLPSLAATDGNYIVKQTDTQMELIAGYSKAEIDAIVGNIDTALTTILYGTGGNE